MELYDEIKKCIETVVAGMDLTDVTYGTIVSTNPLRLELQASTLIVEAPVVELTEAVREKKIEIAGTEVELVAGLKKGDKIVAAKVNSGQKYIILTRV